MTKRERYTHEEYRSCLRNNLPPKRTVLSTWDIRNDSSNIASILQPQSCTSEWKGVYKKCFLSENSCYCKEKKIKPKLMSRPKTCMSLENLKKQIAVPALRPVLEQNYLSGQCYCQDSSASSNDSKTLEIRQELPSNKSSGLLYTKPRQEYEVFRAEAEQDEQALGLKPIEPEPESEQYSLSTILGTKQGITSVTETSTDLNAFRNEHFFQTHSTEDLNKNLPSSHTCVHQFRLDDRLLPEALNVDPYGRSRCSICSKPMEGSSIALSKSFFSEKPSVVSLKNLLKCSELGLVPRSISIGGANTKIELRVGGGEALGEFVRKIRRPEYFNTYALRQQKMLL